jgi:nicotinamidase/pyrazinamidase
MRRALIIVDVQPTFCEGGELPVEGGNAVADRVARYLRERYNSYDLIVTTQDWHVDPGTHFSDTPDFVDSWPRHGVAGSPNAELHPVLGAVIDETEALHVFKGQFDAGYSGFDGVDRQGVDLNTLLQTDGVTDIDVVGLAQSHCVKHTALDAVNLGFKTRVLTDLTAPVSEELGRLAEEEMLAAGVTLELNR